MSLSKIPLIGSLFQSIADNYEICSEDFQMQTYCKALVKDLLLLGGMSLATFSLVGLFVYHKRSKSLKKIIQVSQNIILNRERLAIEFDAIYSKFQEEIRPGMRSAAIWKDQQFIDKFSNYMDELLIFRRNLFAKLWEQGEKKPRQMIELLVAKKALELNFRRYFSWILISYKMARGYCYFDDRTGKLRIGLKKGIRSEQAAPFFNKQSAQHHWRTSFNQIWTILDNFGIKDKLYSCNGDMTLYELARPDEDARVYYFKLPSSLMQVIV